MRSPNPITADRSSFSLCQNLIPPFCQLVRCGAAHRAQPDDDGLKMAAHAAFYHRVKSTLSLAAYIINVA